jgi:hypothetical protein
LEDVPQQQSTMRGNDAMTAMALHHLQGNAICSGKQGPGCEGDERKEREEVQQGKWNHRQLEERPPMCRGHARSEVLSWVVKE